MASPARHLHHVPSSRRPRGRDPESPSASNRCTCILMNPTVNLVYLESQAGLRPRLGSSDSSPRPARLDHTSAERSTSEGSRRRSDTRRCPPRYLRQPLRERRAPLRRWAFISGRDVISKVIGARRSDKILHHRVDRGLHDLDSLVEEEFPGFGTNRPRGHSAHTVNPAIVATSVELRVRSPIGFDVPAGSEVRTGSRDEGRPDG